MPPAWLLVRGSSKTADGEPAASSNRVFMGLVVAGVALFLLSRLVVIFFDLPYTRNSEEGAFAAFAQAERLGGMPSLRYAPQQAGSVAVYLAMRPWFGLFGDALLATRMLGLAFATLGLLLWMGAAWSAAGRWAALATVWLWICVPYEFVVQSLLVRGNHGNAAIVAGGLAWIVFASAGQRRAWPSALAVGLIGGGGTVLNPALAPAAVAAAMTLVLVDRSRWLGVVTGLAAGVLLTCVPSVLLYPGDSSAATSWLADGGRGHGVFTLALRTMFVELPSTAPTAWLVGVATVLYLLGTGRAKGGSGLAVGFAVTHVVAWLLLSSFAGLALNDWGGYLSNRYALHVLPSLGLSVAVGTALLVRSGCDQRTGGRSKGRGRVGLGLVVLACAASGVPSWYERCGHLQWGRGWDLRASDPRAAGARSPWLAGWGNSEIRKFASRYPDEDAEAFLVGAARTGRGLRVTASDSLPLRLAYAEAVGQTVGDTATAVQRLREQPPELRGAFLRGMLMPAGMAGRSAELKELTLLLGSTDLQSVYESAGRSRNPELAADWAEEAQAGFHRGLGLGIQTFAGDLLEEDLKLLAAIADPVLRAQAFEGAREALRIMHPTDPGMERIVEIFE